MNVKRLAGLIAVLGLLHGCVTTTNTVTRRPASSEEVARAHLNLGVAYLRQGRADLAVDSLQTAVREAPRLADAHSALALAYEQLGDSRSAEPHYRRATQLEPSNPAAANSYAVFLCRQGNWRQAEPYFRRAVENPRYPTPAAALTNAGVCARDAGNDLEAAEQYFRAALSRNPSFPDALYNMMDLSYRAENYLQARAFLQRYMDASQPTSAVLWLCYHIELELENPQMAEQCARRLREDFPESQELAQLQQLQSHAGP